MEETREIIKGLFEEFRVYTLVDNSIDYVEKELLQEFEYGWKPDVQSAIQSLRQLFDSHPHVTLNPSPEETDAINIWDRKYDELCGVLIGRAERWYNEWISGYKKRKPNTEPISFKDWADVGFDQCILTDEETQVLEKELLRRIGSGMKFYDTVEDKVVPFCGLEVISDGGLFHIYVNNEGGYRFNEDLIPILWPISCTTEPVWKDEKTPLIEFHLWMGGPKYMTKDIERFPKVGTLRMWNPGKKGFVDINTSTLTETIKGREFSLSNNIDCNDLIGKGLAVSATNYPGIYD